MTTSCPVTGSDQTDWLSEYTVSVTSDGRLLHAGVENRLCLDCGLVFNATGARGTEAGFYSDEYDLHSEHSLSEFMYFDSGQAKGIHDSIAELILGAVDLPRRGAMLDIGCGKGLLLRTLARARPQWQQSGIEPSRNAQRFFAQVLPDVEVHEGTLETSPFSDREFDLVLANGVLEHVPHPLPFLEQFRDCLSPTGVGFIGVPNFATNPADLFTFDHLSRFTQPVLNALLESVGLEVLAQLAPPTRVPMWSVVRRAQPMARVHRLPAQAARVQASAHLGYVEEVLRSYGAAVEAQDGNGLPIIVYGTGSFAVAGTELSPLAVDRMTAFVDDNKTLWGSQKLGMPVRSPSEVATEGPVNLVFSANPCYIAAMVDRAADHGFTGHVFRP